MKGKWNIALAGMAGAGYGNAGYGGGICHSRSGA